MRFFKKADVNGVVVWDEERHSKSLCGLRNLSAKRPLPPPICRIPNSNRHHHQPNPSTSPIPSSNSQSSMAPLKVGDEFPPAKFRYIAYTPETSDVVACGTVQDFDAQKVTNNPAIRKR